MKMKKSLGWPSSLKEDDPNFIESQLKLKDSDYKRVLDIEWNTESNEFVSQYYSFVKLAQSLESTKSNILKVSASFYDPLGIISKVKARVKTIF